MSDIHRIFDLGEEQIVKPSKDSLYRIMNALILCGGKLYSSHSSEIVDCDWTDKSSNCSVVFRIGLPIGLEDKFKELSGFELTNPEFVKGSNIKI